VLLPKGYPPFTNQKSGVVYPPHTGGLPPVISFLQLVYVIQVLEHPFQVVIQFPLGWKHPEVLGFRRVEQEVIPFIIHNPIGLGVKTTERVGCKGVICVVCGNNISVTHLPNVFLPFPVVVRIKGF